MKILFVCTHNRCRSILCEAITNSLASGKIIARSAGSQPVGQVHPLSLKFLFKHGIPTDELKSQSWDDFADFKADVVITVCDSAARETCPHWVGDGVKLHWGLSDPSKVAGSDEEIGKAFEECIEIIKRRTALMLKLIQDKTSTESFKDRLKNCVVQAP